MSAAVPAHGDDATGLALPDDELRRLGRRAVDVVADYLAGVPEGPVVRMLPDGVRERLRDGALDEEGVDADELLAQVRDDVLPYPMGNGHPRFFGWVNSPPASVGIVAELLAAAQNPSCDVGDIASLHLETAVLRWLKEMVAYPADAGGILVSGGTMASVTGLAAARQWAAERDGWNVREDGLYPAAGRRLTLYASDQVHSSIRKAVELLGLGHVNLRAVPTDDGFRLDVDALAAAVRADLDAGHRPFCVVASTGTTNTGAIDPLTAVADLSDEYGLWLHVDGAYGAVARVDPDVATHYEGLERARSMTVDAHKWLSVPVECGCALVRDADLMERTFSYVPPYLHTERGVGIGGDDFSRFGVQQTRGFRALKLWMVLRHAGRRGVAAMIGRHLRLARELADAVDAAPDLERLAPVTLSIVCFRHVPEGEVDGDRLDEHNRAIEARVQTDGRVFLTSTRLRERFVLRACVLHHETTSRDVAELVSVVREVGNELAGRSPAGVGAESRNT